MGPVVSKAQFNSIQEYIQKGIDEGATLVAGGPGRPEGLNKGWYVKPTVFANVTNDMVIAREEIFGPVLVIIGYDNVDQAVEIANDSDFGLAGNVAGADAEKARAVARQIRAGWVSINDGFDFHAAFGGYKKSGNGREWGEFGFHEYLEIKSLLGYAPDLGDATTVVRGRGSAISSAPPAVSARFSPGRRLASCEYRFRGFRRLM